MSAKRPAKSERVFHKPVTWLLGPQLIGSLKGVIVRALYKQLDLRDWMYPTDALNMAQICKHTGDEPFWFDYLADTGDGHAQTYTIAYLCMAELAVKEVPAANDKVSVLTAQRALADAEMRLPRGSFLLVGGDTAYHVADEYTLESRFKNPFRWACEDLQANSAEGKRDKDGGLEPRPLLAIPGNHDYYDMLDGFNRLFRRPVTERLNVDGDKDPQLAIPGFYRVQEATYFAAALPFDWWLYGIDTEQDAIDFRQKTFLQSVHSKHTPKKLIVTTPAPTVVFHRQPEVDEKIVVSLKGLGLKTHFTRTDPDPIADGECRLDLSGDVHHYARYWGPRTIEHKAADGKPVVDTRVADAEPSEAPQNDHFASVVSGLGGAFHHPSTTRHGPLDSQQKYPTSERSKQAIADRLFWPPTIVRGGYARGIGAFIAALIAGAFLFRGSTRWLVERTIEAITGTPPSASRAFDGKAAWMSLLVFGAVLFLIATIVFAAKLATRIYDRNRDSEGTAAYWWCFVTVYAGILALALSLWIASAVPAGPLAFDVALYVFGLVLTAGLTLLAWKVGAKERRLWVKLGFLGLGVWHLLMQVLPVALLIKLGSPVAYIAALVATVLFGVIGWQIARRSGPWTPWAALITWVVYGAVLVTIPFVFHVNAMPEPRGLTLLGMLIIAASIGALLCCIHLAWYLAVSLGFNGHNNEAGGATRIGEFKQFIRFRVEKERITGYVIAVDQPQTKGADIEAKLCDVFTLKTKGSA